MDALLALIDRLEADYCLDQRRVHVMGSSSSAYTAGMLACEAPERIASFQDGMGFWVPSGCVPERPVPLTAITGRDDPSGVRQSVEQWADRNGCEAEPLIEDLGSGVSRHVYQDCDADVVLFDIEGAGHNIIMHECIGPGVTFCRAYAEATACPDRGSDLGWDHSHQVRRRPSWIAPGGSSRWAGSRERRPDHETGRGHRRRGPRGWMSLALTSGGVGESNGTTIMS